MFIKFIVNTFNFNIEVEGQVFFKKQRS